MVKNRDISFIVNTTEGRQAIADSSAIRRSALMHKVYYTTTLAGAEAVCMAIRFGEQHGEEPVVRRLQEVHRRLTT